MITVFLNLLCMILMSLSHPEVFLGGKEIFPYNKNVNSLCQHL